MATRPGRRTRLGAVHAESGSPTHGADDCLDQAFVTLRAPVGARTVVDGSSGEVLAVSAPE